MAASKSIALAQFIEEAAAIIIAHCHQCQSTCWSTLRALGRPNAAVCLLAVPVDALCCWCDCCACAAAKPLPEPRDVLIRHTGRRRMEGGAVATAVLAAVGRSVGIAARAGGGSLPASKKYYPCAPMFPRATRVVILHVKWGPQGQMGHTVSRRYAAGCYACRGATRRGARGWSDSRSRVQN